MTNFQFFNKQKIIIIKNMYKIIYNLFNKLHFFQCNLEQINNRVIKTTITGNKKPNILIICTFSVFGGIEMHCLGFYKYLLKLGYNAHIIIPKNSVLETKFLQEKLPFYRYNQSRIFKPNRQPGLAKAIKEIIKKENIKIVHCNRAKDIYLIKKEIRQKIKLIFTRHAASQIRSKYMKKFDTIISVNKNFIAKAKIKFPNKKIIFIPPFFDYEKFINFSPSSKDKDAFFAQYFGLKLNNIPTIVQIAGLSNTKNHKILLQAIKILVNKGKPINILLCGDGYNNRPLHKLALKLNIQKYVHFLGFTDKIAEITYWSDITTLTSKNESFSIALMEAALLKKPLIGPTNTGVTSSIVDKKTGLLFKNNNSIDLANKIEKLIISKKIQGEYGLNAYNHAKKNNIPPVSFKKLIKLYNKILN